MEKQESFLISSATFENSPVVGSFFENEYAGVTVVDWIWFVAGLSLGFFVNLAASSVVAGFFSPCLV